MFKHIALASKCSEDSVQYVKPGLEHLEHWKALTLAQHQPDYSVQEQLEIAVAYDSTTESFRETPKETCSTESRVTLKNLIQSLKLRFSNTIQTTRSTP